MARSRITVRIRLNGTRASADLLTAVEWGSYNNLNLRLR